MNIFTVMLTDIAMVLTLDDRFKIMGILNKSDLNIFSPTQIKVAMSLACIVCSIIFSEYYKQNSYPNTQQILANLDFKLTILKEISAFYSNWLNNSTSKTDILL